MSKPESTKQLAQNPLTLENCSPVCDLIGITLIENETHYGYMISVDELVMEMNDEGKSQLLGALKDIATFIVSGRKKGETVQ